jgi:Lar family restriction alleviation protein
MSDIKLKPCPFCGGKATLKQTPHIPRGTDYTPTCMNTNCAGRISKKWMNIKDAIEAWNRREGE